MTVTREDIDKAEGDVRFADVTLTSYAAEKVALDVQIASLEPNQHTERAALNLKLDANFNATVAARAALASARQKLASLKAEFAAQRPSAAAAPATVIPRSTPTAVPTGTVKSNSPASTPVRPVAGSTQTPAPVPRGTVPPNSPTGSAAAQPTQPATENTSPQSETEGSSDPISGDDKTQYQLRQTWDEEAVINQLLAGDYFKPNLSNDYDNIAYHWRLFAMPDIEYLYDGDGQITTVPELFSRIDSYKQVTIAETGVTGFNIGDVTLESVIDDNTVVTNINLKIEEPNGVQFLDALKAACTEAGVINYLDFFYYLELTFKGYDRDGNVELTPFSDLPNGGRWLWTVIIKDIDINLGTGGGQYRLQMLNKDASAMKSDYGIVIDTIQARGDTVGEMLEDLSSSLNKAWDERLAKTGVIQHKFKIHGIPGVDHKMEYVDVDGDRVNTEQAAQANAAIAALNGGVPYTAIERIKILPERGDWNNIRSRGSDFAIVDPKNAENVVQDGSSRPSTTKVTANIPRGSSISSIVTSLFSCAETAQYMARDAFGHPLSIDESDRFVNDKGFRECVTWKVIPEVRYIRQDNKPVYDFLSNRYGRYVVWHIYPHIDQEPILSQTQIDSAYDAVAGERFQKGSVAALAVRGLLSKRYDYLFTGVNSEVLNLDLNFNMAWQVMLPRLVSYYSDQPVTHASYNKDTASAARGLGALTRYDIADQVADEENAEFQRIRADFNRMTGEERAANPEMRRDIDERRSRVEQAWRERQQAAGALEDARREREAEMLERFGDIRAPDQNYSREYIEDVLQATKRGDQTSSSASTALLIPFTFGAGDEAKQEVGYGSTGQYHPGRSLYGTILNQSSDPIVPKFTTINMTIRGDPYWIGEGSYETAIAHAGDWRSPDLHDNRIGPNHMIVRFKYPVDVDEGGGVVLQDNETVTGVYKITQVVNKFSGGNFTQEISGNRMPLINLYGSLFGIPVGERAQEVPDPVAASRERIAREQQRAATTENANRIVAEQARTNADIRRQRDAAEALRNNPPPTP